MPRFEFIDHKDEISRHFDSIQLATKIYNLINKWREKREKKFKVGQKVAICGEERRTGIVKKIYTGIGLLVTMQDTGNDEEWDFDEVYHLEKI